MSNIGNPGKLVEEELPKPGIDYLVLHGSGVLVARFATQQDDYAAWIPQLSNGKEGMMFPARKQDRYWDIEDLARNYKLALAQEAQIIGPSYAPFIQMEMMADERVECPSCHEYNSREASHCLSCGWLLQISM